jgi:hypothetical protein
MPAFPTSCWGVLGRCLSAHNEGIPPGFDSNGLLFTLLLALEELLDPLQLLELGVGLLDRNAA